MSVGRVGPEEDAGGGELDLACLGGVESHERFNTAAPTYTLTGPVDFEGGSGLEELRSVLTDFVESEGGLGGDELSSSSGYVQGMVASEEKIRSEARLGEDHDGVSDDGIG